tara:strand:- start:946 stop:1500 length:555 start_codon:yes stop_codon:yes gene_type:complete
MPWTYNGKIIRAGQSFTDSSNVAHPSNWFTAWSDDYKKSVGMVWQAEPATYDSRFYWDADTPKNLDDVAEVDDDGEKVLDTKGNQVITLGLKSVWKNAIKTQAKGLLEPTDWMVIRLQEDSNKTLESKYSTYRAAVRTASGTIEGKIDGAGDLAAFMALFDTPTDSDGNATGKAPISDWPDGVE